MGGPLRPFLLVLVASCAAAPTPGDDPLDDAPDLADVVAVEVSGAPSAWSFAVTVRSPDNGCLRYADWWEVVGTDGSLIYRRVLAHSHTTEQPFTRSGGPVTIGADEEVWVRAHLYPDGYGGRALRGTPSGGFTPADLPADFAPELAGRDPRPSDCAF